MIESFCAGILPHKLPYLIGDYFMKKLPFSIQSFRMKLLISLLVIGLLPLITISVFYQYLLGNRISKDIESASIDRLRYISYNLEKQLEISDQLLGWITNNRQLQTILTKNYSKKCEKQLDIIRFNSYVMEYAVNANIDSNIFKILITEDNGDSFQIGNGMSLLDRASIEDAGWPDLFNHCQPDQLILSKDIYVKDTYIFPVSSRIYNNLTGKPVGWCLITFHNDMFSKSLLNGSNNQNIYLINPSGQCIGHTLPALVGTDMSQDPVIQQVLSGDTPNGHITASRQDTPVIVHYYHVPNSNIIEIQETPMDSFLREKEEVFRFSASLILICAALVFGITMYLRNVLTRPINTISNYIKNVSKGDFKGSLTLKHNDEFRIIADSINNMEHEILALMEHQKQEAEIKKELEFKVLQNQINPHFLYNTLNSIKLMATLQHANTIRDMTAALGRLLQNISKGANKISIYEEMSLLDDYVLIQDIRYDGRLKVQYHIGDPDITQAQILKFLLQPIVENAIFHGIEPKGSDTGTIDIFLNRQNENISIHIIDNGIGMTPEQIQLLLDPEKSSQNHRGLNGIGISNIDQRIKMTYGSDYGISITSELGCYTDVTICIPYERSNLL